MFVSSLLFGALISCSPTPQVTVDGFGIQSGVPRAVPSRVPAPAQFSGSPPQKLDQAGIDSQNAAHANAEPELLYFYDETSRRDPSMQAALREARESGFRIREVAARRFPRLAQRFKVLAFPALIMLRRNRLEARHDGRFTFPRIREMFARARERRMERREKFRELLAGNFRSPGRTETPPAVPQYIQTMGNRGMGTAGMNQRPTAPIDPSLRPVHSPASVQDQLAEHDYRPTTLNSNNVEISPNTGSSTNSRVVRLKIPKPLDRNGRYAVSNSVSKAEQRAYLATVRLRVVDPEGTSHGTGTIIHRTGQDALVLTCGHIFRDSKGRGQIEADVNFATGLQTVAGQLVSYDAKAHDIALLAIRVPAEIQPVKLAARRHKGVSNSPVFTVGCDRGKTPTIRRSHYKRKGIYDGVEKYDVYGRPIDGRSGGGLFNENGELLGVCNAAAVHIDEGIYSGLATIYHQLRVSNLAHLFNASGHHQSLVAKSQQAEPPRANRAASNRAGSRNAGEGRWQSSVAATKGAGVRELPLVPPSSTQRMIPVRSGLSSRQLTSRGQADPSPGMASLADSRRMQSPPRITAVPQDLIR